MKKFEEMQTYGFPPQEIVNDDNKMGQLFGGNIAGLPNLNKNPGKGKNPLDGCCTFWQFLRFKIYKN